MSRITGISVITGLGSIAVSGGVGIGGESGTFVAGDLNFVFSNGTTATASLTGSSGPTITRTFTNEITLSKSGTLFIGFTDTTSNNINNQYGNNFIPSPRASFNKANVSFQP